MRFRSFGAAVLAGVLFLAPLPGAASAAPATTAPVSSLAVPAKAASAKAAPATTGACRPGTPAQAPATTRFFDADRQYLGPDPLPKNAPVGPLLVAYARFGLKTEAAFLAAYRNGSGWIYPPSDGFLELGGKPVRYPQSMVVGTRIDRFGYAGGAYLAPVGTPYINRALPPQNLNSPGSAPQSNYHVYCVAKAFTVDAGPIAPWFGQPGLGLQYKLEGRYLPEAGAALNVTWLLDNGYLVEEKPA